MILPGVRVCYLVLAAGLALAWAGCASPSSRISQNQSEFDAYPAAAQAKIRVGEVAVGFTAPQVRMALGVPDRVYTRTTDTGSSEVWVYRSKRNFIGIGVGFGMSAGSLSGTGAADSWDPDETMRVVFGVGRVTSVERASK